jgi:hypothetical protein
MAEWVSALKEHLDDSEFLRRNRTGADIGKGLGFVAGAAGAATVVVAAASSAPAAHLGALAAAKLASLQALAAPHLAWSTAAGTWTVTPGHPMLASALAKVQAATAGHIPGWKTIAKTVAEGVMAAGVVCSVGGAYAGAAAQHVARELADG